MTLAIVVMIMTSMVKCLMESVTRLVLEALPRSVVEYSGILSTLWEVRLFLGYS